MKTLTRSLFILAVLALPALAHAQAPTLRWDHLGATPAQVATYGLEVVLDGVRITAPASCAARGADTTCSVPLGTGPLSNINHTISVNATLNGHTTETQINYNPSTASTSGPKPATNGRVVIIIVIGGSEDEDQ